MVQRRTCQHKTIDEGDGDTHGQARRGGLGREHRAAARGAVQVQGLAEAGVRGGQDHRAARAEIAEVADQGLVEDAVNGVAVVAGPLPISGGCGARFRIGTPPGIRITIADLDAAEIDPLADAVVAAVRATGRPSM